MNRERWRARYEDVYAQSFGLAVATIPSTAGQEAAYAAVRVVARGIALPVHERGELYHHDFEGDGKWYRLLLAMGVRDGTSWALAVDVFPEPAGATPEERLGRAQWEWMRWTTPGEPAAAL